jgi:hypothetical protein
VSIYTICSCLVNVYFSRSRLPMILGPIFGVTFLVALGVIFYQCCIRRRQASRRAQSTTQRPLADHGDHHRLLQDTFPPVATPALLPGQIFTPTRARTRPDWRSSGRRSQADESSQISEGRSSDPFADDSFRASSRTTEPIPTPTLNTRSIDTVSTRMDFRSYSDSGTDSEFDSHSTLDTTSGLELNFAAPFSSDASSTYWSYFYPIGHYHGRTLAPEEMAVEQDGDNVVRSHLTETVLPGAGARLGSVG